MTFALIDWIAEIEPDRRITASKRLAADEEYLRDHFPRFPVMPGVLMLEALYQAASWLVRVQNQFQHSLVLLHEARNVRYSGFVTPGNVLVLHVDWDAPSVQNESGKSELRFRGRGDVGENTVVAAKLILTCQNLADQDPRLASLDRDICRQKQEEYNHLRTAKPEYAS
jgi:3-hydroxyacyl-[acyl-carrier-protein] dehydratase